MFKKTKAFSGFSVDNLQEAKRFYSNVLGIDVNENPMGLLELNVYGSTPIIIYPKENHTPATFTILNFPVNNIDETVEQLIAKGVVFEHYEGVINTDAKGICRSDEGPDIAWFRDPAGNILSVLEE